MKSPANLAKVIGIAAVTLTSAHIFAASPALAEYACKNSHNYYTAAGLHPQVQVATAIAKANWTKKMKNQYGLAWSVWSIAKGKTTQCVNAGGGQKTCLARARPCKYVVG